MPNKNAYLKEMGIDVWVERNSIIEIPNSVSNTEEKIVVNSSHVIDVKKTDNIKPPTITNVEALDWESLRAHIAECQLCELSNTRKLSIFGVGHQTASLMIIGNAPTIGDEQVGTVFSGEAGKLLTAMLKAMGYQRNDVYITNIVKCKTNENQEPSEEQAASCASYLLRQIFLVKPKIILALGNAAAQSLLKSKSTMSRLRGQLHYVDGINAPILVSYHPTYLLAAPKEKRKAWEDLQLAMEELKK